ncbi:hypothetical protein FHR24_000991 [Wenyingzhuangia heitensis]|uniref:Tetratricopeptide repeat-containing protein n=1 Tax=Wenyingzhuangia heitensis TaxID=1487859 RepID=A0ABX0UBW0_9FLAO|nr:hypothetical protein [Wenyingzhuangia heitensis]NIJ44552.1 hypothetical protein [Wenyingzhuangia heitensis]
MKHKKRITFALYMLLVLSSISCATYHSLSEKYQEEIVSGEYADAIVSIDKNKFLNKHRNELLLYLEKGKVAYLNKDYTLSNEFFNKADILIEEEKKNLAAGVLGVLTNPEKTPYRAEDFEKVSIHYYKALNYIFLNLYDDALVEAKRINLELQKINDSYPAGKKNRYTTDAFALNLQGMLYEATGNLNDAFISYRNALELYVTNKGSYFGVTIPKQLKQDVINTAHLLGFTDEEIRYSNQFGLKYIQKTKSYGEVIVFWENGLVPYKSQSYFTFVALPGSNNGFVNFSNSELGVSFPVPTNSNTTSVLNIAFPKYQNRGLYFTNGRALINNSDIKYNFELIEDYKTIAFKTLKDRTAREIGKIALRVAAKKVSESIVSNQNQGLGALVSIFNAVTEKTDTRNWQTLPNQIQYSRVPLDQIDNKLQIEVKTPQGISLRKEFNVKATNNIQFLNYITPQIILSNK